MSLFLREDFPGGRQRQKKGSGLTGKSTKSKVPIESNGVIVFRIHQKRESGGVRLQGAHGSVGQERSSQAASLKPLVHSQPPDANSGDCRITRQTLAFFQGKIHEGNTRARRSYNKQQCEPWQLQRLRSNLQYDGECLGSLAFENNDQGHVHRSETTSAPVRRLAAPGETAMSFHAEQFTSPPKSFF